MAQCSGVEPTRLQPHSKWTQVLSLPPVATITVMAATPPRGRSCAPLLPSHAQVLRVCARFCLFRHVCLTCTPMPMLFVLCSSSLFKAMLTPNNLRGVPMRPDSFASKYPTAFVV